MSGSNSHISIIPYILKKKGVEHIVISPGSRNAPLIKSFYLVFGGNCISIVDERSAAYYALGLSLRTLKPAVIITTSGTAVLNLSPAIAEAYHQKVPLLAITADRPPEWIDQQDNQTIRQKNVFASNIKHSVELPLVTSTKEDLWFAGRLVNESFNKSISGNPGPVHINIPLKEPLYGEIKKQEDIKIINYSTSLAFSVENRYVEAWNSSDKIMIVCGQQPPNERLSVAINQLAFDNRVIVVAEAASNIKGDKIIDIPEALLTLPAINDAENKPDLVIYFGGQVVSKKLKAFLRDKSIKEQWYIDQEGRHVDTFQGLTHVVNAEPVLFFESINNKVHVRNDSHYSLRWQEMLIHINKKIKESLKKVEWSDLLVFSKLVEKIKGNDLIFAGNSSVIRYLQMFTTEHRTVYSNRGTSGIDGCLSTAAGIAKVSDERVYAIIGDVSFIYDSNALWNKDLPKNLKIIVINNKGGGIFSLIDGPKKTPYLKQFLNAYHPVRISNIAEAFGLEYYFSEGESSFNEEFKKLEVSEGAGILEINTPDNKNHQIFRNFIKILGS